MKPVKGEYKLTATQYTKLAELYFDNPIGFIEDIIVYEEKPDETGHGKPIKIGSQQREVLKAVAKSGRDGKKIAVKSGHGTGKTCVASWIALWFMFTRRGSRGGVVAPTERQVKNGMWQEMKLWIENSPFLSDFFTWTAEIIQVNKFGNEDGTQGTWQIELRTASCQENVAGLHGKGGTIIIIDEASGIEDETIWAALEGATTDNGSMMLLIGNPTKLFGGFYDAFHSKSKNYRTMTLSCESKDYRGNKKIIKEWLETHGRNSNWYRVRALGEFPRSEDDSWISLDDLTDCYTNEEDMSIFYPIIAVDPADYGGDNTEVCAGVGNCIRWWGEVTGKNDGHDNARKVLEAVRYLRENCERFGFPPHLTIKVVIDVNGVGASTRDILRQYERQENIKVIENKSSWSGDETSESMADLLWFIMGHQLKEIHIDHMVLDNKNLLSKRETFISLEEQICGRKYTLNPKFRIESKNSMKKRGLKSPDKGDALSLYCWQLSKMKQTTVKNIFNRVRLRMNCEKGVI